MSQKRTIISSFLALALLLLTVLSALPKLGSAKWNLFVPTLESACHWDTCLDLVHWEDPEGLGGEGGGKEDRDGEYMYIHGWFMSMYDKNHYNIVK